MFLFSFWPLLSFAFLVPPPHICDSPEKNIPGLHLFSRHPQHFPECTKAAQRSMNLLFVLHPPAEAEPLEQLGKQTQILQSKAHSFWVTCSLTPVYRADVKKQYSVWMPRIPTSLEKYFSSPDPSTPGRWIANTWGFLHLSRAASFQRGEVLTIDYLLPAF